MGSINNPKKFIFIAGFVTLIGIGGLGLLLIYFFHKEVWHAIVNVGIESLLRQFITGTVYALVTLIPLVLLLERRMLDATRYFFADLMKKFTVSTPEIYLLSLCAGVGEELLFRGAIHLAYCNHFYCFAWLFKSKRSSIIYLWHGFAAGECRFRLSVAVFRNICCYGCPFLDRRSPYVIPKTQ